MYQSIRREQIIEFLRKQSDASVSHLSSLFSVTKETIRTDLEYLQTIGIIERHHGGASIKKHLLQNELDSSNKFNISNLMQANSLVPNKSTKKGNKMLGKVCVLGSFNVDIVAKVNRFPRPGETIIANETTFGPGGKGANQALAAKLAGSSVHFATKIGKDQFNTFVRNHLKSSEITSCSIYESSISHTGSALIYVNDEAENMIAISPGANHTIEDQEIIDLTPYIKTSEVFLTQLENNYDAILLSLKLAHESGAYVILNPAPYSQDITELLPYVDLITPNETEASELSNITVTDLESAKLASKAIAEQGAKSVLITMGSKGALIFDGKQFIHIPVFNAIPVDTTGAGDAFNGALAASLANKQTLVQASYYASAYASLAVERAGAANMPDEIQTKERINQQKSLISISML